MDGQIELQLVP